MVTKWNEIDLEFWKEIWDQYWNNEDYTLSRVLEIQNLASIKAREPTFRVFFGNGIRIGDWKKWNSMFLEMFKHMRQLSPGLKDMTTESPIGMCFFTPSGPKITPMGLAAQHYEFVWHTCFGGPITQTIKDLMPEKDIHKCDLWYTKENGRYVINGKGKRYIRVRVWDLDDWKKATYEMYYNRNPKNLMMENDYLPYEIIV